MTHSISHPETIAQFQQELSAAISSNVPVQIIGAESKIKIQRPSASTFSTTQYSGIIEHCATDFTITVRSGTLVETLVKQLETEKQYLPFDPTFIEKGATVGGLIATGMNGPCRLRYGGLRDFVIGCQFIDGKNQVVRTGGKVVKNAAGFDLPKFFVGSAGRYGLLLEATFKVFPRPRCHRTLFIETQTTGQAIQILDQLLNARTEFDALEIDENNHVYARWSAESMVGLHSGVEIETAHPIRILDNESEASIWARFSNFIRVDRDERLEAIVKVPISRNRIILFDQHFQDLIEFRRISCAGNSVILFLSSTDQINHVDQELRQHGLSGQVISGNGSHDLLGQFNSLPFLQRVKSALDPDGVFGPIAATRRGEAS